LLQNKPADQVDYHPDKHDAYEPLDQTVWIARQQVAGICLMHDPKCGGNPGELKN
jgi:hypothetical protein